MKSFLTAMLFVLSSLSLHAQYQVGGALGGLATPMPTPVQMPAITPSLTPSMAAPSAAPAVQQPAPAQAAAPAVSAAQPAFPQWSNQGITREAQMFVPRGGIFLREEAWGEFWRRLEKAEPCPLDEARNMALFVEIGERPAGGYRPRVVNTRVSDGTLIVEYTDGKPAGMVQQVITHPWLIVIVPRSNLPVVYRNIDPGDGHAH